jgi:hypothetical protein
MTAIWGRQHDPEIVKYRQRLKELLQRMSTDCQLTAAKEYIDFMDKEA